MTEKLAALIDVCNAQTMDGETEKIEMSVVGTICETDDGFLVEYTEYDEDERCCRTTVRAVGNRSVSVTREGDFGGEMLFEAGKRNSTVYSTPYGDLMMGVYTECVENSLTKDGGRLHFRYTTDFHAQAAIENRMTLTVTLK